MELTRENAMQLWFTLNSLSGMKTSAKGAYGIAKNKRILETERTAIQEAQAAQQKELQGLSKELVEFEEARVELCKEYADKTEEGEPIVDKDQFKIVGRREDFIKALEELRAQEKHAKVLKARDDIEQSFKDFLKESVDIDLHKIKVDDLPNDLTAQQVEALGELVVE